MWILLLLWIYVYMVDKEYLSQKWCKCCGISYVNSIKNIEIFNGDPKLLHPSLTLIRAQIGSRHSNANKYNTYVSYKPNDNSYKAIDGWLCTCKSGKRTVGTCS